MSRLPDPGPRLSRHHWAGWALLVAGLAATLLTPRLRSGCGHSLGCALTEKPFCPYNVFLVGAVLVLLAVGRASRSQVSVRAVAAVMAVETGLYLLINKGAWYGFHLFPRPSGMDGGFPSGHTAAVCALAYLLTERWRRFSLLWYGFAALVGWARWAAGAHYPYQVAGGALLGLTVAALITHRRRVPEKTATADVPAI